MRARFAAFLVLLLVTSSTALKIMEIDVANEGWDACRGEDKSMDVTLTNKLDGNALFTIKLDGPASDFCPRKEWMFNLGMGVAAVNRIQFVIPPTVSAGSHELTITATTSTAPGYKATKTADVTVKDCMADTPATAGITLTPTPTPEPIELPIPEGTGPNETLLMVVGGIAAVVFIGSVVLLIKQQKEEKAAAMAQPQSMPYYYGSGYGGQSYYNYYQQQQGQY